MADPIPAQKEPYKATVKAGQSYFWCACGRSNRQPFCDGSHKGTEFSPVAFTVDENKDLWLCGCKATGKQPFCDGTHAKL